MAEATKEKFDSRGDASIDENKNWRRKDSRYRGKFYKPGYDRKPYGFRGRHFQGPAQRPSRPVSAESLAMESAMSRDDKPIVFDLSSGRNKLELGDWFNQFPPSKVRRSDGVGWIVVLSKTITDEQRRELFEADGKQLALAEEWRQMTEESDVEVTFDTIKQLAIKHGVIGGKWICRYNGPNLDETWKIVASQLACDKMPPGVIGIKISPVNDISVPGVDRNNDQSHVISILHNDMTNEKEILEIAASLRAISIRNELLYKPNVFSSLGIYRNNKYKLRPTIYVSLKRDGEFVVDPAIDPNWSYSRKMSEVTTNDRKKSSLSDLAATLNTLKLALFEVEGAISRIDLDTEPNSSNSDKVDCKASPEVLEKKRSEVEDRHEEEKRDAPNDAPSDASVENGSNDGGDLDGEKKEAACELVRIPEVEDALKEEVAPAEQPNVPEVENVTVDDNNNLA